MGKAGGGIVGMGLGVGICAEDDKGRTIDCSVWVNEDTKRCCCVQCASRGTVLR